MRHLLLALLLLVGLESAVLACTCRGQPRNEAARSVLAERIASESTALVEVQLVSPYDRKSGRGERLRVTRVLAGNVGRTIQVERSRPPQSAACDTVFHAGRRVIALRPALRPRKDKAIYRVAGSCTGLLLADPATRDAVVAAMRR